MKRLILTGMMAVGLIMATAPRADAAYLLTLSSGATTIAVSDGENNPPEVDSCPVAGCVTYIGAVGPNWLVNISTGQPGPLGNPILDLSSVNTNFGANSSITIRYSATDLAGPLPGFLASIGGTLATGHSLTYQAWANANNVLDAKQCAIGNLLSFTNPPVAFGGSTGGGCAVGALYGLTLEVVITGGAGTSSFDANVTALPEPGSMVLLGAGLLGIAAAVRRHRKA